MATPTKLTEDVQHRLTMLVRHGNFLTVAAEAVGLHRNTVYSWIERGEADAEQGEATPYSDFAESLARARAEAEASRVAVLQKAAYDGDWKAAAWLLERQFPERWGQRTEVHASGQITHAGGRGGSDLSEPEVPTDDERLAELAKLAVEIGVLDRRDDGGAT